MIDGVLTVNAGSSSIKAALFAPGAQAGPPLWAGQIERLGVGTSARTHAEALLQLVSDVRGSVPDVRVAAVGHRIVHGGATFERPALIDAAVEARIETLVPLAPLHQPHNLAGVRAARAAFAGVPQVACFDTAFHCNSPEVHQRFALPQRWHDAGVRRYGFHGLSYESVLAQLVAAEPELAARRVVIAHLGNGASLCALDGGKAVATTMSFSPLDGLTMGTRCGRIDAAVVLHLLADHGMQPAAVSELLHQQSGLLGLSGLSSDMRVLMDSDTPAAALAIEHFVESVLRELGGLAAALRGLDVLVFTGGIGENAAALRERIVDGAAWMGLGALDVARAVQVRVICTNEEAVIAQHTAALTMSA